MSKTLLIGCDIGTSGTKAVVTDKEGNMLAHAVKNYGIITPHNQWAEQWPDVWLDAAVSTIAEVAAVVDPDDIAGICISALYGGTGVLCDDDFKAIRPTIIWMDRRAEQESKWVADNIGEDKIFEISGNGIDSYFGYTKLLWVQNNERENWEKIRNIIPIHSYIIYKLTGELMVDYCSAGNVGGIYDYSKHGWSETMASRMNINMDLLPKDFRSPSDIAGGLNGEFAKKMGIPEETPVCTGTVDCIASMLSATIVEEGDSAAILGTSLNWGYIHNETPRDAQLVSMPYCIKPTEMSYTYGGASTAGALPRWFVTNFMQGEAPEKYDQLQSEVYENDIPPGSSGLMILPYFMGERTPIWDESATGLVMGLSLMHTRAHVYRAILESSAYSLLHIMQSMSGDTEVKKIVLVGGGSKSRLWKEIFADVTGVPIYTPVNSAEAPLGDAFLAGIGTGLLDNYNEIRNWVAFNPPVMPNLENHKKYKSFFKIYKGLYPALKDDMKKLRELS